MSKKISGAEYPLAKIFSSDFDYVIPSYQRPYAWTVDQTSELFDDLHDFFLREPEDTYFLGSIVFIKDEGKPYAEVIHGQQRLTTLTILLAALTAQFSGELRADFENYIREPGRASQGLKPKPRLALRERDLAFFADHVQALQLDKLLSHDPAQLNNESQRNIQGNARLLLDRLKKGFGADAEKLCEFGAFLVQRCFLVAVSTPSQQSAFRVFSVLNSRGLDLLPTDIIKSNVIGRITQSKQDEFTDKWEELEVQTGRNGFAELFGHIRMIYARVKARRRHCWRSSKSMFLPPTLRRRLRLQGGLTDLMPRPISTPNTSICSTANTSDINGLLRWLNRIDNSDWLQRSCPGTGEQPSTCRSSRSWSGCAAFMPHVRKNMMSVLSAMRSSYKAYRKHLSFTCRRHGDHRRRREKSEMWACSWTSSLLFVPHHHNYFILRLDSFFVRWQGTLYDPSV